MSRVIAYIDGFNLYFGLRSKGWKKYYWLDLHAFALALIKPYQQLVAIHYFTARIRGTGNNSDDIRRQNTYLEALQTLPKLTLHFGHYLDKPRLCRKCGNQWMDYEEKMTDVNIATQLLTDAFEDRFDTALLISADSDLIAPVSIVCGKFPNKRIIVALPPARRSHHLIQAASGHFIIKETAFRRCQLPTTVTRPDGYVLHRPEGWR